MFGKKLTSVWVVARPNRPWELVAICTSEERAVEFCEDDGDYYFEVELDAEIGAVVEHRAHG